MAKINILDSSIFNLISAGEVVDKPMSVVKELIENSIDAGARNIEIEIKKGGIDYIRVTDDGCGIEKGEIRKAFMPHATSKINSIEDLNSILTLGFRGEALASIAAVSKVTLISRTEEEEFGQAIIYDSGLIEAEYECGAVKGTSITVENIFEKVPARQKFLRSSSSEEADIVNLITRLILANPTISFKYKSENKKLFSTGENEKSALIAVYGNEILNNMEEISLVMPDITIRGFIGKPSFSKHSRNYQTLVVNGRYVKNEEISYMIFLCYKDFLMTRQYPTFLLYIDLPADMVDVNVHPSKMEVKFVQLEIIKKHIKNLINSKLNQTALAPKEIENNTKTDIFATVDSNKDFTITNIQRELKEQRRFYKSTYVPPNNQEHFTVIPKSSNVNSDEKTDYFKMQKYNFGKSYKNEQDIKISNESAATFLSDEENLMTVGTLFSTYIIIEDSEACYLIDQHAAHERILYDKLVKQINEGTPLIQGLLLPYPLDLTPDESALIEENLPIFSECGFDIEKKGNHFVINAVPAVVSSISISKFIPLFFDAIKYNELNTAALIKDSLAQSACKAAVKGDRLLSHDEIKYLVDGVNSLNVLQCPHGRPIAVKLTKTEIEKWFKRK